LLLSSGEQIRESLSDTRGKKLFAREKVKSRFIIEEYLISDLSVGQIDLSG
jgi:hypothetical protein